MFRFIEYTPHHDFSMPGMVKGQPSRFATMLFYLNDKFNIFKAFNKIIIYLKLLFMYVKLKHDGIYVKGWWSEIIIPYKIVKNA